MVYGFGVFLIMLMMMQRSEATSFTVGGSNNGWTVPSSNNSLLYNQWAQRLRFQIGDSLLFVYQAGSDSVLRVTKDDYTNCNTNSALEKYTDGKTEFKLSQSGPYYFISGNKDNCLKGEKLVLVVLADRNNKSSSTTTQSPPSPPPSTTPAPSPSTLASPPTTTADTPAPPAPSPSTLASPPTTTADTPAPSAESPPRSGAPSSLAVMSFVGSLGAFVGSSVVFLTF